MTTLTEYETLHRNYGCALVNPWAWEYHAKDDTFITRDAEGWVDDWYPGAMVRRLRELAAERVAV